MLKFIVLAVVIVAVLWLVRSARRGLGGGGASPSPHPQPPPLEMVRCSHCKVHLPAQEALMDPRGVYCCEAHRQAGPAPG